MSEPSPPSAVGNITENSTAAMKTRVRELNIANVFFVVYGVVCFLTVVWHCGFTKAAGTSIIWALACATTGGAFGFLFGIPKILQNDRLPVEPANSAAVGYRQQVNTNLTEISDWLTKIIVGLSLINLGRIPGYLNNTAQVLAVSIDSSTVEEHRAFAYGLIVCFTVLGFLGGYLYTRLYLQGMFSRADQEAAAQRQNDTDARVATLETQVDTQHDLLLGGAPVGRLEPTGESSAAPPSVPIDMTLETDDPMAALRQMANTYMNIRITDYSERLRRKDAIAKKMFQHLIANRISKDDLVQEIERSRSEGVVLALAHFIVASPEVGDLDRLVHVAYIPQRWHIQYRVVQAIGQLFAKHCATATDRVTALRVLDHYESRADASLLKLIRGTRSIIERSVQQDQLAPA